MINMGTINILDTDLRIGNNNVLQNINFQLDNGEMKFLIGRTGSGKTTFINSIFESISGCLYNWVQNPNDETFQNYLDSLLFGKRVFKMAPIHHHFEKKGWPESTVVIRFWIISIILAMIGLATLKLR